MPHGRSLRKAEHELGKAKQETEPERWALLHLECALLASDQQLTDGAAEHLRAALPVLRSAGRLTVWYESSLLLSDLIERTTGSSEADRPKLDEAQTLLGQLIETRGVVGPEIEASAWYLLGRVLSRLSAGDDTYFAKACDALRASVDLSRGKDPETSAKSSTELAELLISRDLNAEEAVAAVEYALGFYQPDVDPVPWFDLNVKLGVLLLQRAETEEHLQAAADRFGQAIEVDPRYVDRVKYGGVGVQILWIHKDGRMPQSADGVAWSIDLAERARAALPVSEREVRFDLARALGMAYVRSYEMSREPTGRGRHEHVPVRLG